MTGDITPFIIRIQTALEKGGIEGAKTELAALTAEAEKSKKANEGASGSSDKLGQSVGKAAELTGNLSAAMANGGPAAQQMSAGMRTLSVIINTLTQPGAGGIAGLATLLTGAAVAAYVAYDKKVEESRKQLVKWREDLHANFIKSREEGLGKSAAQFDELSKAMDAATAARNRLSAAEAAADSAEKGARLADITLREKQAQLGLKSGDELSAAKVSARFAKERRDLEAEYAAIDSDRELKAKGADLTDNESRLRVAEAKQVEFRKDLDRLRDDLARNEKGRKDNAGAKAPMKQVYSTELGPGGEEVGVLHNEIDRTRQFELDSILKKDLEKLKPLYEKAAKDYMSAIDATVAQEVAVKAAKMDYATAQKKNETVSRFTPAINAVETASEEKGIGEKQAEVNVALFHGRLESLKGDARNTYGASRAYADRVDASRLKSFGMNSPTYRDAQREDKAAEDVANKAKSYLDALQALEEKVKNTPFEEMTKSVQATNRRLDQIAKGLNELKAQTARPGSGG